MSKLSVGKEIRLTATLPMLGECDAVLYSESADILHAFGYKKELMRLRKVPHLGVASLTVTGINHSRLEYALLQCAVISIVARLFKGDSAVAISGSVKIPGRKKEVSSGEELLKAWALISNFGHLQNTYAEERAYLIAAQTSSVVRQWLVNTSRNKNIRDWIRGALDGGRDHLMHYVLGYRRIASLGKGSRSKGIAEKTLSALLLPIDALYKEDSVAKFKLIRLRHVYETVRLVCMLAIDSYYSAQPIRFQIAQTVLGLPEFMLAISSDRNDLKHIVDQIAGWFADSIYLHPRVIHIRRAYEVKAAAHILQRAQGTQVDKKLRKALDRSLWSGLSQPTAGGYRHLMRLTLRGTRQSRLLGRNNIASMEMLQNEIVGQSKALLSVDRNRFLDALHIDIMVGTGEQLSTKWLLIQKLCNWLVRAAEAQVLSQIRNLIPLALRRGEETVNTLKKRLIISAMKRYLSVFPQLFMAVVYELLPAGWSLSIEREGLISRDELTLRLKARFDVGVELDELTPYLTEQIAVNPHGLGRAVLQELEATKAALADCTAPLIVGCLGTILVKDQVGRRRDELDGLFVAFGEEGICVRIVEAKTSGSAAKREKAAFEQLGRTRDWIRSQSRVTCRRTRIEGMGAMLSVAALQSSGAKQEESPRPRRQVAAYASKVG